MGGMVFDPTPTRPEAIPAYRRNVARNVCLCLAGVNVPYVLAIVAYAAGNRAPGWLYLCSFFPPVVTLPSALRAFRIYRETDRISREAAYGEAQYWVQGVLLTGLLLFAAHLFFFAACFSTGVTCTMACGPFGILAGFVAGVFFASWGTYKATDFYLRAECPRGGFTR
ncbi:MAG: hypothetical protein U0746_15705 [Gemmataceae bacterium]